MQSRFTLTTLALLIGAACAGANAQSTTREQTRQELIQAVREGGLMRGEVEPRAAVTGTMYGRTRAEVRAELEAAQRSGDLLAAGEASQTRGELNASRYPQATTLAGKTRAQVLSELAEARRSGDLLAAGESGLTQRQLHPGLYPRVVGPLLAGAPASGAIDASVHAMR
jgi:hypothetical protein